MKFNKGKGKGKVHPSPSSSSSSSSSFSLSSNLPSDPISILNLLLPAAILTLISILSLQDKETLAYIIIRSLNSPIPPKPRKPKKKSPESTRHESPIFDCDCFKCYMGFWSRWNSSPHRELIHQAIEAFEDNLAKTEQQPKKSGRSRRREKEKGGKLNPIVKKPVLEEKSPEMGSPSSENRDAPANGDNAKEEEVKEAEEREKEQQQCKGLVRNVIGFFNSRLWNLWGSNFSLH